MRPPARSARRADGVRREVLVGGVALEALRAQLQAGGIALNALAQVILARPEFTVAATRRRVVTVELTAFELLDGGGTTAQLDAAAASRGLAPGPVELAVHLRLQTRDPDEVVAPAGAEGGAPPGALMVAAPPLPTDDGRLLGFYLRRIDGVDWLRGYRAPPDHVWRAADRFVYVLQR